MKKLLKFIMIKKMSNLYFVNKKGVAHKGKKKLLVPQLKFFESSDKFCNNEFGQNTA